VLPRISAGDAAGDELPTAEQAPLIRPPVPQADDGEPPTAVLTPLAPGNTEPGDTSPSRPEASEPEASEPEDRDEAASEAETSEAENDAGASEPEAADAEISGPDAGLPDETAIFPRVPADDPAAETSEPTAPIPVPAAASPELPPANRPPDITRPQLILDDTMVDMAAVRTGQKPSGSSPSAAGGDATAAGKGAAPAGKSAKRSRSVFGPEPAARPDMLTNAETVVMASLKNPKSAVPGESPATRDSAASAGFA
jgi:hypothetical protein